MNTYTINLICSVIALLAGVTIFGWFAVSQYWRARAQDSSDVIDVPASQVIRSYSIYIEAEKVGTCTNAGLLLDNEETQLTFSQIVPMDAPHFRTLQRAFRSGQRLAVAVAPIDNDVLQLGMMRVEALLIDADMRRGSTRLEATLSGATLVMPLEVKVSVSGPVPESVETVFANIKRRAAKSHEHVNAAL